MNTINQHQFLNVNLISNHQLVIEQAILKANTNSNTNPQVSKGDERVTTKSKHKTKQSRLNRKCAWCEAVDSPQWRKGPGSTKLCNKCGIRYGKYSRQQKLEREKQTNKMSIASILN